MHTHTERHRGRAPVVRIGQQVHNKDGDVILHARLVQCRVHGYVGGLAGVHAPHLRKRGAQPSSIGHSCQAKGRDVKHRA